MGEGKPVSTGLQAIRTVGGYGPTAEVDWGVPAPATASVAMRPPRAPLQLQSPLPLLVALLLLLTSCPTDADEADGADGGDAAAAPEADATAAPATEEPRVFAFRKAVCGQDDEGADILCAIVRIVNDAARRRQPEAVPEPGPEEETKDN